MKNFMLILISFSFSLFADHSTDPDYDKLWKRVQEKEHTLPKSAYTLVEQIYNLAIDEKRDDQLIKAILYKARLNTQLQDKDPAQYIIEAEREMALMHSTSAKAVFASILGQLYHSYGTYNQSRFRNRTEISGDNKDPLAFKSLEDIQAKAITYFKASLAYPLDKDLRSMEILVEQNDQENFIGAQTLEEVLYFNAITHFANSRSLVSLPTDAYLLNDHKFFTLFYNDQNYNFSETPTNQYQLLALSLYGQAAQLSSLTREQEVLIEISRLTFLRNQASISNKDNLYKEALLSLGQKYKGQRGYEAAYIKLISLHLDDSNQYMAKLDPKHKEAIPQAAQLLAELNKANPHKSYSKAINLITQKLNDIELSAKVEKVVIPNEPILAYIKYRNVAQVTVEILNPSDKQLKEFYQNQHQKKGAQILKGLPKVHSWKEALAKYEDKNIHATEIALPALDNGTYIFRIVPDNEALEIDNKAVAYGVFHVSNLSYVHDASDQSSSGYVTDRVDGRPLTDVSVEIYEHQYNQRNRRSDWSLLETVKTDNKGYYKYKTSARNTKVVLKKGNDILDLGDSHYRQRQSERKTYLSLTAFTDRAIYRPGQSVFYKGLVLSNDPLQLPSVVKGEEVTMTFRDVNWQVVKEEKLRSNEYGTVNGVILIPEGLLGGRMTLELRAGVQSTQHSIRVEEYKRPKIYGKMRPMQKAYMLGDSVELQGEVLAYSGSHISGAKVRYRVEQVEQQRWVYCGFGRGYGGQPISRAQVAVGEVIADDNGLFHIGFPTQKSHTAYSNYSYITHMDIVTATGETTTISKTIVLSSQPYRLDINWPVSRFVGDLDSLLVRAINAEGQNIDAMYSIKVLKLETPQSPKNLKYWDRTDVNTIDEKKYAEQFPYYQYGEGSMPEDWDIKEEVIDEPQLPANRPSNVLMDLTSGAYKVMFVASTPEGQKVEEIQYLFLSEKEEKALPTQPLWVSKVSDAYEPGDKLELCLATPFDESHILYRFSNANRLSQADWISLPGNGEITFDIKEAHRGGFTLDIIMVKHNRIYTEKRMINVPWTNKELNITYETFRNKLEPGSEETWTLKITDDKGGPVEGELAAAMYDASLDQFVSHKWDRSFYPNIKQYSNWRSSGYEAVMGALRKQDYINYGFHIYGFAPRLNLFGFNGGQRHNWSNVRGHMAGGVEQRMMKSAAAPNNINEVRVSADTDMMVNNEETQDANLNNESEDILGNDNADPITDENFSIRQNLKETVFFYPDVEINKGIAELKFTMNEALTKWHLLLFGHTKEFQYFFDTQEIITQKPLMIEPHLPRFVRHNDVLVLSAKVSNLSDEEFSTVTVLRLEDALTGELLDTYCSTPTELTHTLEPGQSTIAEWTVTLPISQTAPLLIKMITKGSDFSDGEQNVLPVLTNRMLVTETLPFSISGGEEMVLDMKALEKMGASSSLTNHQYAVEIMTNPAWIVAKAMPYLTADNRETTTSIFSAFFGQQLMRHLLASNQDIQTAIENWKGEDLRSTLSKNETLKLSSLNETPWVREAQNEEAQMSKLKLFLDDNHINEQISGLVKKLKKRQLSNGGFSWMTGGKDNWYMTQNILEGLSQLRHLNIDSGINNEVTTDAIKYIDARLLEHYHMVDKKTPYRIESIVIHYMYVRSHFAEVPQSKELSKVMDYNISKAEKYWKELSTYEKGFLALAMRRMENVSLANQIVASIQEYMIEDAELGNYWKDQAGYYWYNLNIEKQALMIEVYKTFGLPQKDIDGLKMYLLKTKQTNSWKTDKATAAACYAFLLDNRAVKIQNGGGHQIDNQIENQIESQKQKQNQNQNDKGSADDVIMTFVENNERLNFDQKSLATGYAKQNWSAGEISTSLQKIDIKNTGDQVAFGAIYYQYFEDLDKIESYKETPTKITKTVYKVGTDNNGEVLLPLVENGNVEPGDRLRIRIVLMVDRPMEFMQMKDMRSSGLEPVNVLSQYKYQDGLGYYESTRDLATYFYFDRIAKGHYVFEYDVFAAHEGQYSNGITEIQSMYAPEFSSHSEGIQISITKP